MRLGCNPMRTMGGVSALNIERSMYGYGGAMRNFYDGDATLEAEKSAIPVGYVHPQAWMLSPKSGGMACRIVAGSGDVTDANLPGGRNAEAAITGTGDITQAIGALIVSAVASLTGAGDLAASLAGIIAAQAALTGEGDVTAAIGAISSIIASLTGEGDLAGDSTAKGSMSADINVTGDLLSTANVGDAVWSMLLEAGFDASRVMRIIASAVAGKSTGGPDSPVFRNLGDTQDMIVGTATADGDRTVTSYGD